MQDVQIKVYHEVLMDHLCCMLVHVRFHCLTSIIGKCAVEASMPSGEVSTAGVEHRYYVPLVDLVGGYTEVLWWWGLYGRCQGRCHMHDHCCHTTYQCLELIGGHGNAVCVAGFTVRHVVTSRRNRWCR